MSIVENLLRLHRWQLDERRRYLTELESLAERLRADIRRLIDEIDTGAHALYQPAPGDPARCSVSRLLIERRRKLEHSVSEIQEQMVEARAAIAAAEHELQRREIAAAQRKSALRDGVIRRPRPAMGTLPTPVLLRRYGS